MLSIHFWQSLSIRKKSKNVLKESQKSPFINKYIYEGINYPSEKYDLKKLENNSLTTALNALYTKKEKKYTLILFQNKSQIMKSR